MYGYKKTAKLILLEYLIVMVGHIGYGFFLHDIVTGFYVFIVTCILVPVAALFVFLCKNENIAILALTTCVIISTVLVGVRLKTLGHALLIVLCLLAGLTILMNERQIFYAILLGLAMYFICGIFFWDIISIQIPSIYLFALYALCYSVASFNLYLIVKYAKAYMLGMEEKAKEAELANESKRLFLANMSHEIRTPMNAICGMAELNLRENLSPVVRENTENIQSSGKILLAIVNDILDYSKLESGKMEIIPVSYSISHLVKEVVDMSSVRLTEKDVTIRNNIAEDIPDVLIGDEIRIRQVLFNLLTNAMKFTEHGFIIVDVYKVQLSDSDKIKLEIAVTDSGIGIKEDDLCKLFTSFQQLNTHKSHAKEGTGLGLAICKELCELMGGDIQVQSDYGVGSKFTVNFVQKIDNNSDKFVFSDTLIDRNEKRITTHDAKVLVVDDNMVNLKVANGLLKTFGVDVDTCKSGRECLEILKTNRDYDIIFLDHMMPEFDGIDTLHMIRATDNEYMKTVPLIALTANVMSGVREMFIEEGFDDYVPKPIDTGWLNIVLNKYLPASKIG